MTSLVEHTPVQRTQYCPQPPLMACSVPDDRERHEVERYIAGVFQISYGARLYDFMPLLVSLRERGSLEAALGLRGAAQGKLFCEQYLDDPVEARVAEEFGHRVGRHRILEMGNLVSSSPGQASLLYRLAGVAMYEAGIDYLLFTANRAVRISLKRSGLNSLPIARADPRRLEPTRNDWGSYYSSDPVVMLGDVRTAMGSLLSCPSSQRFVRCYRSAVDELAETIRFQLQ